MNDFVLRVMAWVKSRDRGASAVEYALIVGLIAAVIGGVIWALGNRVFGLFDNACDELTTAGTGGACVPRP